MDWYTRTFRLAGQSGRIQRLIVPYVTELLDRLSPHAVLVPETEPIGARSRSPNAAMIVKAVVNEALNRGIAVHVVSADVIQTALAWPDGMEAGGKDVIHQEVIRCYPELQTAMPRPRRRLYDPEQYFEPLFHAVAMYLAWRRQPSPMEKRGRSRPTS
jgi:hypothetical protein